MTVEEDISTREGCLPGMSIIHEPGFVVVIFREYKGIREI